MQASSRWIVPLSLVVVLDFLIGESPLLPFWLAVRDSLKLAVGTETTLAWGQIVAYFGTYLLSLGGVWLGFNALRLRERQLGFHAPNDMRKVAAGVLFALCFISLEGWFVPHIPVMVMKHAFPVAFWLSLKGEAAQISSGKVLGPMLFSWWLAAVVEEPFYRGLVFSTLKTRMGVWRAVLISSLLFTLTHYHMNPDILSALPLWRSFPFYYTCGVIFAALYQWEKSIWAPIAAHSAINLVNTWFTYSVTLRSV